jgi:membrane protease YdiL (CAAX protease family)
METGEIRINTLMAAMTALLSVEVFMGLIAPENPSERLAMLGAGRMMETGTLLYIVRHWGQGLGSIGLSASKTGEGIRKGLIWSLVFGITALGCGFVLYSFGMNPLSLVASGMPINTKEVWLLLLVGGVIGPVTEEVFFRGICYGFFRKWGIAAALILTTAVFTAAHSHGSGIPITQAIGGIVFAVAYELEQNLLVPVIIHVTGNLAIFGASLYA